MKVDEGEKLNFVVSFYFGVELPVLMKLLCISFFFSENCVVFPCIIAQDIPGPF